MSPKTDEAPPTEGGSQERETAEEASPLSQLARRFDEGGGLEQLVASHRTKLIWAGALLVALALLGMSPVNPGRMVIGGLRWGAVYALVALGLALIYTSTRVLNFAQGEFGSMPAFIVVAIISSAGLAGDERMADIGFGVMLMMAGFAVVMGAAMAVAINLWVIRRLNSPFASLVATAAIFIILRVAQFLSFGARQNFPRMIEGNAFQLFGAMVSYQELIIVSVLVVVAILLAGLFRTPVGVALLASAQEPYAASLYGVSPKAMSSLAWGTAGALGGLAGILAGGIFRGIEPGFMTSDYLIPAFTGAVLGGITSMTGAVIGALLLGLTVALAQQLVTAFELDAMVPNAPIAASFVVLLVILALRPTGLLGKEA